MMVNKNSINEGIINEILKPENPFRGNGGKFFIFVIVVVAACIASGLVFKNIDMVIFPLVILLALLAIIAIPLSVRLYRHFAWSVFIYDKKLVVKDFSFNYYLANETWQDISFEDIDYIYYLEKEYNLLQNYRHKLEKYKISKKEMDYRKENLVKKYAVPDKFIEAFEHSSQKTLNDYMATGVLMAVDKIADKYNIPKIEKKAIVKDLKETDDFDSEYIRRLFSAYNISSEDLDSLKDECSDCDVNVISPFLITKLKVACAKNKENSRGGIGVAVSINLTLVFSNKDGTKKVYLEHFHSLSRANWQKLIHIINGNKSGVKYLMSKQSYRNISDPNFKPGCG